RDGRWDEITLMLLFDKRSEAIARTNDMIALAPKPEYAQRLKLLAERFARNGSDDAAIQFVGTSRIKLCHQYHFVGLARLMDGDRRGAREAFQKCLNTGLFSDVPFKYSRVFLDRLTNDPTWPAWIPAKK